jgi:hypothetical protein
VLPAMRASSMKVRFRECLAFILTVHSFSAFRFLALIGVLIVLGLLAGLARTFLQGPGLR